MADVDGRLVWDSAPPNLGALLHHACHRGLVGFERREDGVVVMSFLFRNMTFTEADLVLGNVLCLAGLGGLEGPSRELAAHCL